VNVVVEDVGPAKALIGISRAAAGCGVSERALRYYEEIRLISPSGKTPGGMRRYSEADLARVRRIRELQSLLGLNLDEIRAVLEADDRTASIREEYQATDVGSARRRELLLEILALRQALAATVDAKLAGLGEFRADLGASTARVEELLGIEGQRGGRPDGSLRK
jgi:DNA-binding transcriptional MerR regulator